MKTRFGQWDVQRRRVEGGLHEYRILVRVHEVRSELLT